MKNIFIWVNVVIFIIFAIIILVQNFTVPRTSPSPTDEYLQNFSFMVVFLQVLMVIAILSWYVQQNGVIWWYWLIYPLYVVCVIFWLLYFLYYKLGRENRQSLSKDQGGVPKELWWTQIGVSVYIITITLSTFFLICNSYGTGCV